MCSAFTNHCGYDTSTIMLIGEVYCPNTKCLVKLCMHKKTFRSLSRSNYQVRQSASVCQVHNIPFDDQTNSFFLSLDQGVYIFEETPKSIQDVIGHVYFPGKYCSNREKCVSFDGYVTTPISIQGRGECEAWLLAQKVPFYVRRAGEDNKNRQHTLFFATKG